jgi:microcystin-dependent protein
MKKLIPFFLCVIAYAADAQTSIGIGTTTPDPNAVLDIRSTNKGVLFPKLSTAQQTTLASMLGPSETGMIVTDATTGLQRCWTGSAWATVSASNPVTAAAPLTVTANALQLNAGTQAGDLLTWDGANWINAQPAVQHFSLSYDNHAPYLALNYVISLYGIFPTQADASQPYVGEIFLLGCNFPPVGWLTCNGALLSIAEYTVLFDLIGTTYGGDGITTFAIPNLSSRIPVHMGNNGTSTYVLGESGGSETKVFTH